MADPGELRRGLGLRTTVATSTGLAFSAFNFLGAVTVALFVAGDAAWLAILIAGLLALLAASAFGELNSLYPSAAAIRVYMKHSMDDRVALTIEGKLPSSFARLNDNAVPYVPVIVLGVSSLVVATLVYASQSWLVLVAVAAALEAMIYAVAYCVIMLRRRQPDMARAQRMRSVTSPPSWPWWCFPD